MSDFIKLNWVIESTNQQEQRIYRKIDDNPEELLTKPAVTITEYEDTTALGLMTSSVSYRVESVGIYRGEETIKSSPVQSYIPTPPELTEAFTFRTLDNDVVITSAEPFYMKVNALGEPEKSTTVGSVEAEGVHTLNYTLTTDQYMTELSLYNLDFPNKYVNMDIASNVGEVYLWSNFDWGNDPFGITFNKAGLTGVPNYKPKTKNLNGLFKDTPALVNDPKLAGWDVTDVVWMDSLFENSGYVGHPNGGIERWNTENVESMNRFAANSATFNLNLSNWCVSKITDEPTDFATGTALTAEHKPTWGTCPVQNVTVSIVDPGTIAVDATTTLTYTTDPEITAKTVVWTSENIAVATVDNLGVVTGVSAGNAMISVLINGRFSDITEVVVQ